MFLPLDLDDARAILAGSNCGEPVGYRVITTDPELTGPPCDRGCLAPGSSPHYHAEPTGFTLIGTTGIVDTDLDLNPYAVRMIYPFGGDLYEKLSAAHDRHTEKKGS